MTIPWGKSENKIVAKKSVEFDDAFAFYPSMLLVFVGTITICHLVEVVSKGVRDKNISEEKRGYQRDGHGNVTNVFILHEYGKCLEKSRDFRDS